MANETDIEVHKRRVAFSNTLRLALQQEDTIIWQYTEPHSVDAELGLAFDEMPAFGSPEPITAKLQPITVKPLNFTRRWLQTTKWHDEKHWDTFDLTKTVTDPQSSVLKNFRSSFNRKKDEVVVAAMIGSVQRGMNYPGADTATAFDTTNQVVAVDYVASGSAANSGMTRAKIIKAKQMFMAAQADMRQLHCALTSKQWADLANDTTLTNDQHTLGTMDERGVIQYLGVSFHIYEYLPLINTTHRRCLMWTTDGVRTGVVTDFEAHLDRITTHVGYPWQAHVTCEIGAARADEKLVVDVRCIEA